MTCIVHKFLGMLQWLSRPEYARASSVLLLLSLATHYRSSWYHVLYAPRYACPLYSRVVRPPFFFYIWTGSPWKEETRDGLATRDYVHSVSDPSGVQYMHGWTNVIVTEYCITKLTWHSKRYCSFYTMPMIVISIVSRHNLRKKLRYRKTIDYSVPL